MSLVVSPLWHPAHKGCRSRTHITPSGAGRPTVERSLFGSGRADRDQIGPLTPVMDGEIPPCHFINILAERSGGRGGRAAPVSAGMFSRTHGTFPYRVPHRAVARAVSSHFPKTRRFPYYPRQGLVLPSVTLYHTRGTAASVRPALSRRSFYVLGKPELREYGFFSLWRRRDLDPRPWLYSAPLCLSELRQPERYGCRGGT